MSAFNTLDTCPDCKEPFFLCGCDVGEAADTVTVKIPYCPQCQDETGVYCMECSYDFIGCDCVDEPMSWYCMRCDFDFEYDIKDTGFEEDPTESPRGSWQNPEDGRWYWSDGQEAKCYCYNPKVLLCKSCCVSRDKSSDVWQPWIDITIERELEATEAKANGYSSTYAAWSGWPDNDKHLFGDRCGHKMTEVVFGDVKVYASSINDRRMDNTPEWGLYADWIWQPWWRNEHIDWPDFGVPVSYETATEQIIHAYGLAKAGQIVEIGCIGGHGRTGTILACMGVLSGMTVKGAILHVETTYCHKVIETWEQEWWVEWFEAYVSGNPEPERPEKSVTTPKPTLTDSIGSLPTSSYSLVCTAEQHHKALKQGTNICWSDCGTWEHDLKRFLGGWDKGYVTTLKEAADVALTDKPFKSAAESALVFASASREHKPVVGQVKDGFVYTLDGWVPDNNPAPVGKVLTRRQKKKNKAVRNG